MSAVLRLQTLLHTRRIPPLLLLSGVESQVLEKEALQFASNLIERSTSFHPDLHLIHPEGKTGMHSIQAMRTLCDEVALPPHSAPYKVFILFEAERMLESSSNALLKTFEEPPARTVFILLSTHPRRLLPTLLSRAQVFHLGGVPHLEINLFTKEYLTLLANRSFEGIKKLTASIDEEKKRLEKEFSDLPEKEREGAVALKIQEISYSLLQATLQWYRDKVAMGFGVSSLFYPDVVSANTAPVAFSKVVAAVEMARMGLERNIKLETCLEALFLRI